MPCHDVDRVLGSTCRQMRVKLHRSLPSTVLLRENGSFVLRSALLIFFFRCVEMRAGACCGHNRLGRDRGRPSLDGDGSTSRVKSLGMISLVWGLSFEKLAGSDSPRLAAAWGPHCRRGSSPSCIVNRSLHTLGGDEDLSTTAAVGRGGIEGHVIFFTCYLSRGCGDVWVEDRGWCEGEGERRARSRGAKARRGRGRGGGGGTAAFARSPSIYTPLPGQRPSTRP